MKRFPWIPWRWWRRGAQLALLLLFVCLFRRTEYAGADTLPGGENLFFRWDPLAAAAAMLAGRSLIAAFWPALALLLLTLLLGRFFCGWVCPLGTLLDIFQRCVRPLARRTQRRLGGFLHRGDAEHSRKDGRDRSFALRSVRLFCSARYFLLLLCLVGAACAFQLVGFVDPFALLVRGLAFWADPRLFQSSDAVLTWAGQSAVDPVRQFFMKHLLPFRANTYHLAAVSTFVTEERSLWRVSLIGVSWGDTVATVIAAMKKVAHDRGAIKPHKRTTIPLIGEPLGLNISHHSSSVLAARLEEALDPEVEPGQGHTLSLAPVPALIPADMTETEIQAIRKLIGRITAYREIFGTDRQNSTREQESVPLIRRIDAVLTSTSTHEWPLGFDEGKCRFLDFDDKH
ncbi:MAG: 4Fe-4S binding protein, partial [Planctomycetota bacterium]